MSTPQTLDLTGFPEELLEGILSHCLIASLSQPPRPSWHRIGPSPTSSHPIRGRLALLLVCKKFLRISTPLFYHTVHILSASQLHRLLLGALRPSPQLASHIRRIVFSGIWAEGGEVLRISGGSLRMLDITLDSTQLAPGVPGEIRDLDAEEFCEGLKGLASLTHIVIRKPNDVYITRSKPRYVLSEIATAMREWNELEYADIAFRVSDDSGTTISNSAVPKTSTAATAPVQHGPITALTQALSTRPKLHTFSTLLPSIWNESVLRVSTNPSLERIILGDGSYGGIHNASSSRYGAYASSRTLATTQTQTHWSAKDFYASPVSASLPVGSVLYFEPASQGIMGTGLFLLQARKHTRLSELIRAGTYITRTRAQTLDTQGPPMPSGSSLGHQWQGQGQGPSSPIHALASPNTGGRLVPQCPIPNTNATTSTTSRMPVNVNGRGSLYPDHQQQQYQSHHHYQQQPSHPHYSNQAYNSSTSMPPSQAEGCTIRYPAATSRRVLTSTIQNSQQCFSKRRMTGA